MAGSHRSLAWAAIAATVCAGAGCNSILGPTSPDPNWRPYTSEHFTLLVRPGSFAEGNAARLAEVLEDQRAYTTAALGFQFAGQITGFLYTSAADAGRKSDRSGVGYPDNLTFEATCTAPFDDSLLALVSHEANHVILQGGLGRPGTAFLSEGLASAILSERFHRLGKSFLHGWTRQNQAVIPPLATLVDDGKWDEFPEYVAYNASGSFLAWLLDTYKAPRLRVIYYASSGGFGRRFQETYGLSLEEAERAWRAFCAQGSGQDD